MAETAIGLFENIETADAVEDALRANGMAAQGIRVVRKPVAAPAANTSSRVPADSTSALADQLRRMGAKPWECEAYVDGVRRGKVLVLATGSRPQVDTAMGVMNAYNPIELEELATGQNGQNGVHAGAMRTREEITLKGEEAAVSDGITLKSEKERARSEGARVFSW